MTILKLLSMLFPDKRSEKIKINDYNPIKSLNDSRVFTKKINKNL